MKRLVELKERSQSGDWLFCAWVVGGNGRLLSKGAAMGAWGAGRYDSNSSGADKSWERECLFSDEE